MSENTTQSRKYPPEADIILASREGSERYCFRTPVGSITSIPAMNEQQARELAADGYRGFGPDDFEPVDSIHAEPEEYPDVIDSDRDVNEHDLWMLRHAMRRGQRAGARSKRYSQKNPTEYTIQALLDEWDDAVDVPLHDRSALQQASGIGPDRAGQVVGAAVANRLIERPIRSDSDE